MKSIEKDIEYMEGTWAGEKLIKHLPASTYGNLEVAIGVKETVVKKFEEEFGYSRNMPEFDRNYAFNAGMLDALIKYRDQNKQD